MPGGLPGCWGVAAGGAEGPALVDACSCAALPLLLVLLLAIVLAPSQDLSSSPGC